jgi:ubiquinone/menaquinone biosynthesis C-methylase UbiE
VEEARPLKSKDLFPAIFSRHAAAYQRRLDEIMARGEARGRERAIELIEARPGMRVLDLACGPGTLTRRLAALVAPDGEVIGVDLAEGMLALARAARIANARFEVMDMEHLTFADSSFDAATCGHGLQFVSDLERALGEARRVVRDRGPFAASMPADLPGQTAWAVIRPVVDRFLPPAPQAADRQATQRVVADPALLQAAAQHAGFAGARVEVIDEKVRWESAEHFVSMVTSWWDCAARLEGVDRERREAFEREALIELGRRYPGPFETTARNHVLFGRA